MRTVHEGSRQLMKNRHSTSDRITCAIAWLQESTRLELRLALCYQTRMSGARFAPSLAIRTLPDYRFPV